MKKLLLYLSLLLVTSPVYSQQLFSSFNELSPPKGKSLLIFYPNTYIQKTKIGLNSEGTNIGVAVCPKEYIPEKISPTVLVAIFEPGIYKINSFLYKTTNNKCYSKNNVELKMKANEIYFLKVNLFSYKLKLVPPTKALSELKSYTISPLNATPLTKPYLANFTPIKYNETLSDKARKEAAKTFNIDKFAPVGIENEIYANLNTTNIENLNQLAIQENNNTSRQNENTTDNNIITQEENTKQEPAINYTINSTGTSKVIVNNANIKILLNTVQTTAEAHYVP